MKQIFVFAAILPVLIYFFLIGWLPFKTDRLDHGPNLSQGDKGHEKISGIIAEKHGKYELPPELGPSEVSSRLDTLGVDEIIRIFFATDRNVMRGKKEAVGDFPIQKSIMFGNGRSDIKYGTCWVSMPKHHSVGKLESPSIFRLEFKPDPNKHIVVVNSVLESKKEFFGLLSDALNSNDVSSALLFVHGYNVTFEDAARRTAQITYDINFKGAPIFYSWPSQGRLLDYIHDEQNVEWAQANLKNFLDDLFRHSDAQNVYLIAHSMGNRALTRAVTSLLKEKPAYQDRLKVVILAAPDIDADVFKRDIAPALAGIGPHRTTLYASSKDVALNLSSRIHGNYRRAGESGKDMVVVPGIDTIDASNVDTLFPDHSYIAESRTVLSDMHNIINNNLRADSRPNLHPVDSVHGHYWKFTP